MEEKEVLSGALAKAELGRVTARAALADLVAAAEPLDMPEKPIKDDGKFIPPEEVLRFSIKHYDAVVFGGVLKQARKVMKEEA